VGAAEELLAGEGRQPHLEGCEFEVELIELAEAPEDDGAGAVEALHLNNVHIVLQHGSQTR